ncbi:MAG TPA: hypothetical protein VG222_02095 [Vicinamibacterales bacterium]|jgi:hypothetical protein|nr:hypothetical protein [Vicinamibacterales bacterium]
MPIDHFAKETPAALRQRIAALERELVAAQNVARLHQLAAEQARDSARRGFQLAAWGGATRARESNT